MTLIKNLLVIIFSILIVLSSYACRKPISYFQPGMTKEDVIQEWGDTPLKTFKILNGKTYEMWQYNFSGGICYIIFENNQMVATHVEQPKNQLTIRDALLLKLITK